MSAYSDALQSSISNTVDSRKVTDEKIKKKWFDKMQSRSLDYLINQNYGTILLICFILIIIYFRIFLISYPMMENIHCKHEYFKKQLKIEREELNKLKDELVGLRYYYGHNVSKHDMTCQKCWFPILDLNLGYIINHVLENNKHIKKSYNDTLLPLQCLLIAICFLNTICIMMIFREPFKLFLTSNLFAVICLSIYGEIFIKDKPNVYYTLIIGVGILLFSLFLLIKILMTLLNIIYYQRMKDILTSEELVNIS
ncbi:unnamed protein product [Rotaria sp. Silwood2]|nr:unnamed protein product [Rotaria sp. Silwood2]CAF4610553.1 unnamed protein product [Rotaria sp. Silwood2]